MKDTTDHAFSQDVLESPQPVIVDFWAPWCGPCRMVAPELAAVAQRHPEWTVVKLNIDENQQTAAEYGVLSIPTMMVFNNGAPQGSIVGAKRQTAIESDIKTFLA